MKLIVGLGNPGKDYNLTRHNIGFVVIDHLAERLGLEWFENKKFKALIAKNGEVTLMKPQTFMNLSGEAVRGYMDYYKMLPKGILFNKKDADISKVLLVIHDELDLDLGKYKISADSRSAGHNGVQSIIDHLKTKNFSRLRVGINNSVTKGQMPGVKFVLGNFTEGESSVVENLIPKLVDKTTGF